MMKRFFGIFLAALLVFSCEKNPSDPGTTSDHVPTGLEVSGGGISVAGPMVPVAEGVWDIYGEFTSGEVVHVTEPGGKEDFVAFKVTPLKAGLGRLRVKADKTWNIVKINKVSLVVTEGGIDDPVGNKPPVEAVYKGGGVWTVSNLYVATDHIRYRYELETDTPSELKYWCATWDNAGVQPSEHTPEYLKLRALGQDEYDQLHLKENRACWMIPAAYTLKLAGFTLSLNAALPTQEIAYAAPHFGPKAVFMGDSITWQWGTNPREIAKSLIEPNFPLDPLPSWMQDRGANVLVTWRPQFFTQNDYVDKGISGNNTNQMIARYEKDVIKLDPHCVVIMAGTNDIAQGETKDHIMTNITSMANQADAKQIKVILCSVTPCNREYSGLNPKNKGAHIIALNTAVKELAESRGYPYCDYFPCLVDETGLAMQKKFWLYDDLHPNPDAYVEMEKVIKPIIENLLAGD